MWVEILIRIKHFLRFQRPTTLISISPVHCTNPINRLTVSQDSNSILSIWNYNGKRALLI